MTTPEIAQKAPYVLNLDAGTYYWCACGKSAKQPFCDGSHADSDITPTEFTLEKPATVAMCGCKHSKDQPFCDGSHNSL